MHDRIHLCGPFRIPFLKGPRIVRVYVPPRADLAPPVLFMFDGQNIFDDGPSHTGGWWLHHAARDLAAKGLPAPVIVGIDHGGVHRLRELSPFRLRQRGQAPHFIRWIVDELAPWVRRTFHTRGDIHGTAIGGSSMGGLAALYAHFYRPEVFGAALCMSPSLWVAQDRMLRYVTRRRRPRISRIYLDAGAHEPRVRPATAKMARLLRQRGFGPEQLCSVFDPEGRHHESAWRRRAPDALEFLYSWTCLQDQI